MNTHVKVSAPDWCFYTEGMEPGDYYRQLKECGVTAAEMVPPERRQAVRDAGLILLNHSGPGMQKGLNRLEHHAELLPQICRAIDEAQADGIPHLIVFSGNGEGLPVADGISNCITGLTAVAPYAEQAGITLVFEMLNSYDHADFHACHGSYGFEVGRGVGSASVGVIYDIYHMLRMGDDVLRDIDENMDVIKHFHLAEPPGRTLPCNHRNVDYAEIISLAVESGYDGYWGLEFVPGEHRFDEIAASVRMLNGQEA